MPRRYWLDAMPTTISLRSEELACPRGDMDSAIRVRDLLRDYLDTHRGALLPSERRWLRNHLVLWGRRIDSPSDWFRLNGDSPFSGRQVLTGDYGAEKCLLRVDEILRYYEGRSNRSPAQIFSAERARRERERESRARDRRRAAEIIAGTRRKRKEPRQFPAGVDDRGEWSSLERIARLDLEPEPEAGPVWMSPQEREGIMAKILESACQSRVK